MNEEKIDLRARFTKNAEEFDSLMVLMLAENEQLKKDNQELIETLKSTNEVLIGECKAIADKDEGES